jgi:hypothetical protein
VTLTDTDHVSVTKQNYIIHRLFKNLYIYITGTLEWNKNILTTGSGDRIIYHRDQRSPSDYIQAFIGHKSEVADHFLMKKKYLRMIDNFRSYNLDLRIEMEF